MASINSEQTERLQIAQWLLDKQLECIASADAKVAVVITLNTAIVAILASTYATSSNPDLPGTLLALSAGLFTFVALFCAAMSIFPRVKGSDKSLVFFGSVAENTFADYVHTFATSTVDHFVLDITAQVHRNAEIAKAKYVWVRRSIAFSFLVVPIWVSSICFLFTS